MKEVTTYISPAMQKNYDPTHTTALRKVFTRDMKKRFTELMLVLKQSIVDNDCFGLQKEDIEIHQMVPAGTKAFKYLRDPEKVEAFMKWIQEQVNKGLLDIRLFQQVGTSVDASWTSMYVLDSYKRGVIRAREELIAAGYDVPSLEATGGIFASMALPMHLDRVGVLYTRVFSDLKGITAAMDAQISRILAQGIIDGDGPALLARKLVSVINGDGIDRLGITDALGRFIPAQTRATLLARTEIIRAHHLATIQEYRNWGLEGIIVKGEWHTAGDDRVCDKCAALKGKIFTLDEIEPMIPLHPQCRCIALPYIKELQKYN